MERVFNKLVRDNIPNIIIKNGDTPYTRILDDNEYKLELLKKLEEETKEVVGASNKDELLEEIADVYEVLLALIKLNDCNIDEIEKLALNKAMKNGRFDKKIFLEKTDSNKE